MVEKNEQDLGFRTTLERCGHFRFYSIRHFYLYLTLLRVVYSNVEPHTSKFHSALPLAFRA